MVDTCKSHEELVEAQTSLFESGAYGDLTIKCQDREWRVHKNIVCVRSGWFRNACKEEWKEGSSNTIDLSSDDPAALEGMLQYLYTLQPPFFGSTDDAGSLIKAQNAFVIGDKYDVKGYRDAGHQHILDKVALMNTKLAREWPLKKLDWVELAGRMWKLDNIEGVLAIREAILAEFCDLNIAKDFIAMPEFKELLEENAEFMLSYVKSLVSAE